LDKGGVLVLELPNVRAAAAEVLKDDLGSHMAPQHLYFFSPETLRRLAREAGFQRTEWGHSGEPLLWLRSLPWDLHVLRRRSLGSPGGLKGWLVFLRETLRLLLWVPWRLATSRNGWRTRGLSMTLLCYKGSA
jgi:hypothetical protein